MSQTAAQHEQHERRYRTRRDELVRLLWDAPPYEPGSDTAHKLALAAREFLTEAPNRSPVDRRRL
jgi:hypothetical protein